MTLFRRQNALSTADIEKLEYDLKITLPTDYKKHIISINGKTYSDVYISSKILKDDIPYAQNISLNKRDKYNVYQIFGKVIRDRALFPFARTDFGDFFCFDLANNQVVLWLHETEKVTPVCKSFTELQKMLH